MRHSRVSCSPIRSAMLAIGIDLASASTKASNRKRETRTRASPGNRGLVKSTFRASHPRRARVQECAMLKKIQMPPRLRFRVAGPRIPRPRIPRRRTGSRPENPHSDRADPPRPKTQLRITFQGDVRPKANWKRSVSRIPFRYRKPPASEPGDNKNSPLPTRFSEEPGDRDGHLICHDLALNKTKNISR